MDDKRWSEVKAILAEVMEYRAAERSPVLSRLCGSDAELRKAVESLLEVETRAGELMNSAALPGAALRGESMANQAKQLSDPPPHESASAASAEAAEAAGRVIGRYRLLDKIGEGGMGEVWQAEQSEPVRRRVAVKLIRGGISTREVIARFESERQALALMDHPAIARVFDAGSTPQAAPYFVMEYVAGVPITVYCDNHRLSNRERLNLFTRVCEGVQHAHQKAIMHRDLKPSNILVTEVDGRPAPKIIDFGVAKALTQKLSADTFSTRAGVLVGTPEYMSPEQASSSGEDIDTRTDVYSLGIVLYELLAGMPPIELRNVTLEEFLRRLREEDPQKPSTRIRTQDRATTAALASNRRTEPLVLYKQLRGDLDSIALKALEKQRSQRYGSAAELAADIDRYLKDQVVQAVAPSTTYRARKFARRYRGALVTGVAFALMLLLTSAYSMRQGIRANQETAMAQAVNDFLQNDLLAQASADKQLGRSARPDPHMEVRTALDRAAARVQGKFGSQPLVEASIRQTIGNTYLDLGLYPEAQRQLERAVELRRRLLSERNPDTLNSMHSLAAVYLRRGMYAQAGQLETHVLELRRRVLGARHPDTLLSLKNLAAVYGYEGKYAQAETLEAEALAVFRRVRGDEHPDTLDTIINLAGTYHEEGKYARAESLLIDGLKSTRRVLGPEHPRTLLIMNNLANVYLDWKKYVKAEPLYTQVLEIERRVLGAEHSDTLRTMSNLGMLYDVQGKYAQAEALDERTLAVRRRIFGTGYTSTLIVMDNLTDLYTHEGKYQQAEALALEALEAARRALGEDHPDTLDIARGLADVYSKQGKYRQAATLYARVASVERRVLGDGHPDTLNAMTSLGRAQLDQLKFSEAEISLREALKMYERASLDIWERYRCQGLLGASLAAQNKFEEAETLLLSGYEGMVQRKREIPAAGLSDVVDIRDRIIQLYRQWGRPMKAAEWQKKPPVSLM